MTIANCVRCHQVFNRQYGRKICQDCVQAEEDAYRLVVAFLDEHPGSKLDQITAGTEVDEAQILRFIREGRLTLLEKLGDDARVACRHCGVEIQSGDYCPACQQAVGDALRGAVGEPGQISERENRRDDSSRWHDRR